MRCHLLFVAAVVGVSAHAAAAPDTCASRSMTCDVQTNVVTGTRTTKLGIVGVVSKHFVSGVPGNAGSDMELPACNVVAIEIRTKKHYSTAVNKKGAYTLRLPAGSYQVIFDDCFKCVVKDHAALPTLTLKKTDTGRANASCNVLGK